MLDRVLDGVLAAMPEVRVERLRPRYQADDDNVVWLGPADAPQYVQVETRDDGTPPFVIESDAEGDVRFQTSDPDEAITWILGLFRAR